MMQIFLCRNLILIIVLITSKLALTQDMPFPTAEVIANAQVGQLILNPDTLKGYSIDYGILVVAESNTKDSRRIELPVVRIHSKSHSPQYPVFHFEGGPGLPNIKITLPDSILENHDYVRVGYRGRDGSPSLDMPEINRALKETPNILHHEGLIALGNKVDLIVQDFQKHNKIDLREYNVINVVDDMEQARKAMGYEHINITAYSFGGAIAYSYCVRYPESIHRVMYTEGAFPFYVGMAKPSDIDAAINDQNELWKKNPENQLRSPDIIQTIRNVLKTLPRDWNGVTIDHDVIRFMTWGSLNTREMTAQCFNAYVAAENGDYNGLAALQQFYGTIVDLFNWGDMLSKTFSTDTGEIRDFEALLNQESSIIGSPLSLLGWGLRQNSHWPVKRLPKKHRKFREIGTESLIIVGKKEMIPDVEKNQMPYFKNGHLVAHENVGHMDLGNIEFDATQHMEKMFFLKGIIDISKFKESEVR
ncbi:MAG: alpha/beta fold hydrolase [Calditrichaeota bacterium]|nr:MAG: alpha/beta fold hydrolase [Calditrichota bacterium]